MKANSLNILLVLLLFCFQYIGAQELGKKGIAEQPIKQDSILQKKETANTIQKDSILEKGIDSIKKPKEVVDDIVTHNAQDYTIQNAKNKTVTLYNEAHVIYGDIDLKAGKIIVDYKNNTVFATGIKDSTGTKYEQKPVFKQGSQESEQDSIKFNFKTKKALVYGIKTIQGEMITYGEKTKRINDSTVYMRKLRFTTSKKKVPDYYIATEKAKLVPGKKIIVGGSNLVIADVPTPIYLPFAYFPLSKNRTAGFIIPSWGENNQQGFFLQNGGYYLPLNDYLDIELTGDIYSNGSWAVNTRSNYYVRYKYSGGLSIRYQKLTNSILGLSDYSKSKNYNITWNHSQDSKTSPNSRLSASVNLSGSGSFYRNSLNEIDNNRYLDNSFNSSINYSKKFIGTPFNLDIGLRHSQNSRTNAVSMTLPSLRVNMDRIYPFQGKGGIKRNALQKIGINYNLQSEYRVNTNDEEFFTAKMFREAQTGVQHNISASTNVKVFKYFTLTPSANYKDVWYFDRIEKSYDPNFVNPDNSLGGVVKDTISGFNRFNQYSVSASLSTSIYGNFNIKSRWLKKIRHTMRPSISWGYTPELASKHELQHQKGANPNEFVTYSPFEGGIYGQPSSGESNSIGISLSNVVEAKVATKDPDSEEEDRKIFLINNLNFNTSYNFIADSIRWSKVSFSAGIPVIQNRLTLNINGTLDPYQINEQGQRINKFNTSIFRLERAGMTTSFRLSDKDFTKGGDKDNKANKNNPNNPPDVYNTKINPTNEFATRTPQRSSSKEKNKETELYKAKIPWDISFSYGINYSNTNKVSEVQNHTLGFSGNFEPSPKWKIGFRSGYDIKEGAFSYTSLNFARDLDSWRFNFNWIPFGDRTSYNFFIGVKSSMLSDLKWDKVKPPDKRLF